MLTQSQSVFVTTPIKTLSQIIILIKEQSTMKRKLSSPLLLSIFTIFFFLVIPMGVYAQQKISIEWGEGKPSGSVEIRYGIVKNIEIVKGKGKVKGNTFQFSSSEGRISFEIENARNHIGPLASLVSIKTKNFPFSFFSRDVKKDYPIYIPSYSVVVLEGSDNRSYAEVESKIKGDNRQTKLQKIETEPEETFELAKIGSLNQSAPTLLGLSRDFRIFKVTESMPDNPMAQNVMTPSFSSAPLMISKFSHPPIAYQYTVGRGVGNGINTHRHLEDGVLPILNSIHRDDDIEYHSTYFVSLEKSPLSQQKGTDFLVADQHSTGHMLTAAQEKRMKAKLDEAFDHSEETVLYFKSEITNKGSVPRYAWFKTVNPVSSNYEYNSVTGLSRFATDTVFAISKLNGKPLQNEEMSVLIQPNEKVTLEFYVPHSPISTERALALSKQSFDDKFKECKNFWLAKLNKGAQIHVPDKRIDEMIRAGALHLDLVSYANEPNGTLTPAIGVYSPIGTECSPIVQFYNSYGWPTIAKRSLNYFLEKQHDNGFMQNFGRYMVETGAVLWSIGEYYRYTQDKEWIVEIKPKVLKSVDFLLEWRNRNKIDSLRGKGYGLIDGKVADPEDNFRQFMLNGYAYLGLSRTAELLKDIDVKQSKRIQKEAEEWKKDIQETFYNSVGGSPVIPMGDGTWSSTAPPWAEAVAPRALFANKEKYFSHGTFTAPDALIGPMYLVFTEVFDVNDLMTKILLDYHRELFYQDNTAFSQPYYSRHNWIQAKLGMVKPFLKTYYNTLAGLVDRETYTFWEHNHQISPHKTHEEAWFLMQTRWMLYMEEGSTLRLMKMIPRKWMEDGKSIELQNVQSYFGALSVNVTSKVKEGFIEATIACDSDRKPGEVTIRLPHPENKKPIKVIGGTYNPDNETVTIPSFGGNASVRLEF